MVEVVVLVSTFSTFTSVFYYFLEGRGLATSTFFAWTTGCLIAATFGFCIYACLPLAAEGVFCEKTLDLIMREGSKSGIRWLTPTFLPVIEKFSIAFNIIILIPMEARAYLLRRWTTSCKYDKISRIIQRGQARLHHLHKTPSPEFPH